MFFPYFVGHTWPTHITHPWQCWLRLWSNKSSVNIFFFSDWPSYQIPFLAQESYLGISFCAENPKCIIVNSVVCRMVRHPFLKDWAWVTQDFKTCMHIFIYCHLNFYIKTKIENFEVVGSLWIIGLILTLLLEWFWATVNVTVHKGLLLVTRKKKRFSSPHYSHRQTLIPNLDPTSLVMPRHLI